MSFRWHSKASNSEKTETKELLKKMKKDTPEYLDVCQYFLGDKGYDSQPFIEQLEGAGIKPVIDIRNCWKDGEETHQYRDTDLVYNYKGDVWYVDEKGEKILPIGLPPLALRIHHSMPPTNT